jgi:hypothetical protein
MRRETAIELLHTGMLDRRIVESSALREELRCAQEWWHKACTAINEGRKDPVLQEEAQFALEWCIGIAQKLIEQELAARNGTILPNASELEICKAIQWRKFAMLEAGFMSNGIKRPANASA